LDDLETEVHVGGAKPVSIELVKQDLGCAGPDLATGNPHGRERG
jgi:hypothetical protein